MDYQEIFNDTVTKYSTVGSSFIHSSASEIYYSNLVVENPQALIFDKKYKTIIFVNCLFKSGLTFLNCEIEEIEMSNCFVEGDIDFHSAQIATMVLNLVYSKNKISFYGCDIKKAECDLYDGRYLDIRLNSMTDCRFELFNTRFEYLNLIDIKGNVSIRGEVSQVKIIGVNDNASFIFDRLGTDTFLVDSLRNQNGFKLYSIYNLSNSDTSFTITNSYLGKAEFYDINLGAFDTVKFTRTHLIDCSFIDVTWNYELNTAYDADIDVLSSRETFRQLKYALGKQGDTINEQKFHILEMKTYLKSLDLKNWKNWGTYLIIKLSDVTSDFGQSLGKPFGWLLLGHLGLFLIAMLVKLSSVHISLTNPSLSALNTAVYEYLYLINPLHKTEDLPKDWTIIIDILMRIWSSYMIYNIIRASRRFIK